jgi:hypothetical protein
MRNRKPVGFVMDGVNENTRAVSQKLPPLSVPTDRCDHDGLQTYRHLPKIREGEIRIERKKKVAEERIEIRKGSGKQPFHYVHIAANNEPLSTSENLKSYTYAVKVATEVAEKLGVPVKDMTK